MGQAEFPENLKGVIPEYPGAIVELGMTNDEGTTVHMEVAAEPKAVTDFYKNAMARKGWTVEMDQADAQGSTLVLNKAKDIINVTAVGAPGQRTRVIIALMSE